MNYPIIKRLLVGGLLLSGLACGQDYKFDIPPSLDEHNATTTYNKKVDVIFIVDDSQSMDYHQKTLSESIPDLVQKLEATKLDLHFAVISTSMGGISSSGGRFIGTPRYLTSQSPDLTRTLSNRLLLGNGGRDREAGLESLFTVLNPSYLAGEGDGFFRREALLAVIELTTEDDKSGLGTVNDYVAKLDQLKPRFPNGDRAWVFNLVGTLDTSSSCPTNPQQNFTERADTLIALAQASQGQMDSICSSTLVNAVRNIRAKIVQILSEFRLTRVPDLSTMKVYMNDVLVPRSSVNGWDYIPSKNSIRFYGTWLPTVDAKIKIDYQPSTAD
jgi:hypothetical protein